MKNQPIVETKKIVAIMTLYFASAAIALIGVAFSIISLINNIYFTVVSSQVHGAVFGVVVAFLGVRYFMSVRKLKNEVYKPTSRFSWDNFKKQKKAKLNRKRA